MGVARYSKDARVYQEIFHLARKNDLPKSFLERVQEEIRCCKYRPNKSINMGLQSELQSHYAYINRIIHKSLGYLPRTRKEFENVVKPSYSLYLCYTNINRFDRNRNIMIEAIPIVSNKDEAIYQIKILKFNSVDKWYLDPKKCTEKIKFVHRFKKPNSWGNLASDPQGAYNSSKKALIDKVAGAIE